jgi:hypothetical protein
MAISEESRHHLYQRLEQVLGPREATVLMEHLPPVGWADVATKRDLDALETRMNMRFELVDEKFVEVDRRFDEMNRRFVEVDRRFDQIDHRFDQIDHRFDQTERHFDRVEGLPGEFRSMLISVMTVMAVLFATMMGAVVAAIRI